MKKLRNELNNIVNSTTTGGQGNLPTNSGETFPTKNVSHFISSSNCNGKLNNINNSNAVTSNTDRRSIDATRPNISGCSRAMATRRRANTTACGQGNLPPSCGESFSKENVSHLISSGNCNRKLNNVNNSIAVPSNADSFSIDATCPKMAGASSEIATKRKGFVDDKTTNAQGNLQSNRNYKICPDSLISEQNTTNPNSNCAISNGGEKAPTKKTVPQLVSFWDSLGINSKGSGSGIKRTRSNVADGPQTPERRPGKSEDNKFDKPTTNAEKTAGILMEPSFLLRESEKENKQATPKHDVPKPAPNNKKPQVVVVKRSSSSVSLPGEPRSRFRALLASGKERLEEKKKKLADKKISFDWLNYKQKFVFGNSLANVPRYKSPELDANYNSHYPPEIENGLPEFVVRCLKKIETMKKTDGLYRINGDADAVQKLKGDINKGRYDDLDSCHDVSLLTSTFKLFLREMVEPLINRKVRDLLCEVIVNNNKEKKDTPSMLQKTKETLKLLDHLAYNVLRYVIFHLKVIAEAPENRMDAHNLSIVFSPNIVHNETTGIRPELVLMQMDWNNIIVEKLIANLEIFC